MRYWTDADYLGYVESQVTHIEEQVYKVEYPEIRFPRFLPVSYEAHEWAKTITHRSMDMVGQAEIMTARSTDMPMADVTRDQKESPVHMIGMGYDYDIEELNQAMMLQMPLTADKAESARFNAEKMLDDIAFNGHSGFNWQGFFNHSAVTGNTGGRANVDMNAGNSSREWANKTGDEIIKDINDAITGVWVDSLTVQMADTVALPPVAMSEIANRPRSAYSDMSILEWVMQHNAYTMETNQPLSVMTLAGAGERWRKLQRRPDDRLQA